MKKRKGKHIHQLSKSRYTSKSTDDCDTEFAKNHYLRSLSEALPDLPRYPSVRVKQLEDNRTERSKLKKKISNRTV